MTRPDYCLGCDPGNHGAFALLDTVTRKIVRIWDMPLDKDGKIHPEGVAMVIDLAKSLASTNIVAAIENVTSRPRQAHAFSFGLGVGVIHGCLGCFQIPTVLISPSIWKSACGLRRLTTESQADTKTRARELATRLWPEHAHSFRLVKQDGAAEACLIARYHAVKEGWIK